MPNKIKKLIPIVSSILFLSTPAQAQMATPADINCLAKVMHHEARGEGVKGQTAVAYVVLNRINNPKYPKSVCSVVYQPGQFSGISKATLPTTAKSQFASLASSIISSYSHRSDPTRGAIAFHNGNVWPSWEGLVRTVTIGAHIFYR